MKNLVKSSLHSALVAGLFLLFAATGAIAQPGSGGPQPTEPAVEDPVGIPIDGGASLLLAAGAAYGIKKVNDFRKGKKQAPEA